MPRPTLQRALSVWMNGERVGTWAVAPHKPDEFIYAPQWLTADAARPISLSLPLRPTGYRGAEVAAFFDNLLPESREIRTRLQQRFSLESMRPFDLLAEIGRDCVGAIQLLPEQTDPPDVRSIDTRPITASGIERHLENIVASPIGRVADDGNFRFSLAGAQEKTALTRLGDKWHVPKGVTPTTHILKLPIGTGGHGIDLSTSVENEWLCAEVFKAFGFPVAKCRMETFGGRKVLVVERFDRRLSSDGRWIVRLPAEDLCQATGSVAARKYESDGGPGIRRIMTLLLGSSQPQEDRRDFFKTQILFWMLCAIDGHAKNFSIFVQPGGAYRLTPRYDILSAHPVLGTAAGKLQPRKVKMAMAAEGTSRHYHWHSILPRHWQETARRCGIAAEFESIRQELLDRTPAVVESVGTLVPKGFPDSVASPILKGLRSAAQKLGTMA